MLIHTFPPVFLCLSVLDDSDEWNWKDNYLGDDDEDDTYDTKPRNRGKDKDDSYERKPSRKGYEDSDEEYDNEDKSYERRPSKAVSRLS